MLVSGAELPKAVPMTDEYTQPPSIHEVRRAAPFHYLAKAGNARFAASLLWNLQGSGHKGLEDVVPFGGSPDVAIIEAFRRETAFALESIIKAVVAQRIEFAIAQKHVTRVYPTHRLDKLWLDAELPKISLEDYQRLLITTQYLSWAGRYAAPNDDAKFYKDMEEIEALDVYDEAGESRIRKARSFEWSDFDRIYAIAAEEFWSLRKLHDPTYQELDHLTLLQAPSCSKTDK